MSEEKKEKKAPTATEVAQGTQRLELLLTDLYNHPTDRFYAHMFYHIDRRAENKSCPTMGVGMQDGRIKLVYNTEFLATLNDVSATEILKHECLHLINDHLNRGSGAKEKDMLKHKMENIAQDCAINQYLNHDVIKEIGGVTLESFREVLKNKPDSFVLESKMPYEYYYDLLEQEKEEREQNGDGGDQEDGEGSMGQQLGDMEMDDHGQFGEMDALDQAMLEEKIKQAAEGARADGAGNLPSEVEELLKLKKKPVKNWKRLLRQFIGGGVRSEKKCTRSRRNRRYGLAVAGSKRDHVARILVVLDTSGSMCYGDRTEKVLSELYGIWKSNPTSKLQIVECDAEIQDVFTYEGKGEFKVSGGGGTSMTPALEYADKHKYDGVIFLTDGEFWESFKKYKTPSLWVIAGNAGYKSPIGKTVHLD